MNHPSSSVLSSRHWRFVQWIFPVSLAVSAKIAFAQTAAPVEPAAKSSDEVLELSPFVVESKTETGWVATQTLAGSRLNTSLKDIAAPIEVLTKDFMDEFALNSIGDAAIYTVNVEGTGDNLQTGTGNANNGFPPPSRIRGIANATNSRDFFSVRMPSDNYNTDRVTVASGPNNLLFGMGSPAGVVDSSLKRAEFRDFARIETQFDSFHSQRYAVDLNRQLIEGKLAIRYNGLHEEREYAYKPNGTDQKRHTGTIVWRPFSTTTVSVHYEDARVHTIRPSLLLPFDEVSPWYYASQIAGYTHTTDRPEYVNAPSTARFNASSIANTIFRRETTSPVVMIGNVSGYQAGGIYNVGNTVSVQSPRLLPSVNPLSNEADGYTFLDATYFPTDVDVAGLSKLTRAHSKIGSIFLTQRFGRNLFVEFAAQRESYEDWNAGLAGFVSAYTIRLDPNKFLADGVTPNSNFGKKYVETSSNNGPFRDQTIVKTRDWRLAVSYEVDLEKHGSSWWRRVLGRQRFGGLLSGNASETRDQSLRPRILPEGGLGGTDPVLAGFTLRQPYAANGTPQNGWADDVSRQLKYRYYLSDTDPIVRPSFDIFSAPTMTDATGKVFTLDMMNTGLKDEWGRRLGAANVNQMLKNYVHTRQLSYQGFFWDDRLVLTAGVREDATNRADVQHGFDVDLFTGLQPLLQDIRFLPYDHAIEQTGRTTTRGFVARPLHRWIRLPMDAELSITYNRSNTFQPDVAAYTPFGGHYAGAKGAGEDKGVRLDLWGGKFSFHFNRFDTTSGPQRAGNIPYNRFRRVLGPVLNRVTQLAYGTSNSPIDSYGGAGYNTLGDADPYWVTSNIHSKGDEISLDWNVTENLQLRFNMNRARVVESDIGTDWWEWMALEIPKYQVLTFPEGGITDPRDLDGNGRIDTWTWDTAWRSEANTQTIASWYQQDVIEGSTGKNIIQSLDGRANEFARENRFNVLAVYRFNEGRLKGLSIGGAFRYRAAPLLSYGHSMISGNDSLDLAKPFYGKADRFFDLSLNYRGRSQFWAFRSYRIGLNVRNLLSENRLFPMLIDVDGAPIRVGRVAEPRNFILSLAFDL